ncbi:HGGxSTG domain-containing protein [Phenylobacterium sp.]|uniref:HGGxSTG domain-containing protein n=1 Tax=Phenylobacterium sp. TaxID=1871053 RepID=UPI00345C1379
MSTSKVTPMSETADKPPSECSGEGAGRLSLVNLMHLAPRCGAKTRAHVPCQAPAIRGKRRCRMHGGKSPGAPRGSKNGNYRHGLFTLELAEARKRLRAIRAMIDDRS